MDAFVFERASLERPERASEAATGRRFLEHFERRIQAAGDPFASAVQSGIEALVGSQVFSQEKLAKLLGMSIRSLQRRLRECELSYQQLDRHEPERLPQDPRVRSWLWRTRA